MPKCSSFRNGLMPGGAILNPISWKVQDQSFPMSINHDCNQSISGDTVFARNATLAITLGAQRRKRLQWELSKQCWLRTWAKTVIRWTSIGLVLNDWGILPLMGHFPGLHWSMKKKDADLTVCYVLAGGSGASFACAAFQWRRNKLLQMHWKGKILSPQHTGVLLCLHSLSRRHKWNSRNTWLCVVHIVKDRGITLDIYYVSHAM